MAIDPSSPLISRRIGNRSSLQVQGCVLVAVPRRRKVETQWIVVDVEDASMTGVGFVADLPVAVPLDTKLMFALAGIQTPVRVVRVTELPGRLAKRFGVEFVESGSPVLDALHRLVHGDETAERDDRWRYGTVD